MKLITRDTDYAIKTLIFMAKKKDEITSVIDRGLSTTQVGELFDKFNEAEKNINKEVIEIWFPLRLPILKRQMYCYLLIVFLLLWVIFT